MTHEELIEKVANAICQSDMNDDVFDELSASQKDQYLFSAKAAIFTIFAALKEPTDEMADAGLWPHEDDSPVACWQAMLNASPLAGEKRGAE